MSTKSLFKSVALQVASVLPKTALGPKGLAIQAAIIAGAALTAPQEAHAVDAQTIGGIAGTVLGAAAGKKIGDGSTTNAVVGGILGGTLGSQMGKNVDNAERAQQYGNFPPQVQYERPRPYGSYGAPYYAGNANGYYPAYDNRAYNRSYNNGPSTASAGCGQPNPYGYRRVNDQRQTTTGQTVGTVGGAVLGGLAGRALGGSNKGPAAVVGAVLGGIAGNAVGRASDINNNTQNGQIYQVRPVAGQVFYPQGVPLRIVNPGNLPPDMYSKLSTMYQSAANLRATAERSHFEWQQAKIEASLNPGNAQANSTADSLRLRLNDDINNLNKSYADASNATNTIRRAGYEPGDQFVQLDQQLRAPMARSNYQFIDANGNARNNLGFSQGPVYNYGEVNAAAQPFRHIQAVNSVPQY